MAAWYVVVVGRKVGVFDSWLEAGALVDNLSQARHEKFRSRDAAYAAFDAAKARGEVRIVDANPPVFEGRNPVMSEDPPTLNDSPLQVRVPPTNTTSPDLPNESRPDEPPESSTFLGGEQTIEQRPEMAETSRTSNEEQLPGQSKTLGPQQCSSTSKSSRSAGVQTMGHHVHSAKNLDDRDTRRSRPSRIQRNIDSDVSEPESLVSVEIIDKKAISGKSKVPAVLQPPSGTKSADIGPSRRHRVIEPVQRHSSLEFFQVHSRSSTTASASSSRRVFVSTGSDVGGYPSGTESSGPDDVTPRRSQRSRRDKGKGKQSRLVMISSSDESYANDPDSDPSVSEIAIATPSRRSARNSEVVSLKSRGTTSRQSFSTKGSHRTGSPKLPASRESNHPYPRRDSTEDRNMPEALGPPDAQVQVYEPRIDPRSPIRRTPLPEIDSSPTFGRPSPRTARPLTLPSSKFSMT